jgi:glycosyltransferase involved in cell wall biosynthesis
MNCRAVAVIIPACNEVASIEGCLASVAVATQVLSPIRSLIVVVDDGSTDATVEVARDCLHRQPHVLVQRGNGVSPNVGRARADGVARALEALATLPPQAIWLAFTDADTRVPPRWLCRQLAWAMAGADAVAGIVRLPPEERAANSAYEAHYAAGISQTGHDHVHGANLGVSAAVYQAVGGMAALRVGEDQDLWRRLHATTARLVSDPHLVVQTSARRTSRVVGGLATVLADFDAAAG